MLESILEYLSVIALRSLKVLPGLGLSLVYKMNTLEIFICLSIGGILGVILFTFLGEVIRTWLKKRRMRRKKDEQKPLKIRKARRILRLWHKYGLIGIAILTPPMISPPFGVIIAVAFRESRARIILYMAISVLAWALVLALLGDQILDLLGQK